MRGRSVQSGRGKTRCHGAAKIDAVSIARKAHSINPGLMVEV
jgi:hypothetical protein